MRLRLICPVCVKNTGMKFSLPVTLDILFYTASVWLLSFGLMRALALSLSVCILVSVLAAGAAALLLTLFLYGRRRKKLLSKRERQAREALLLHLALEREEKVRAALLQAYVADGKEAHCEGDALEVEGELAVPLFTMQPLSADAVARTLKEYGGKKFFVVCNALSPEAEKLLASFAKRAVKGDEVFRLFSRTETTPSPLICGELPRKGEKFKRAFSKRNARPFFLSGAMLLFLSLFTLFPIYYLAAGGALLVVSVLVRVLGYAE